MPINNNPIDFFNSNLYNDTGTLHVMGAKNLIGCDDMSLLCVIPRSDFIAVASDSKYMFPNRKEGEEVYFDKFFNIDETEIIIGSTGCITYGKRHFFDLVKEINGLENKSFKNIHDFIETNFSKYIKENNCDVKKHFSHVYLFGWENKQFYGNIFNFFANGDIIDNYSMSVNNEYFTGDKEGCDMLMRFLEPARNDTGIITEDDCISFLEESFLKIIECYNSKPKMERSIGGDVQIGVLYKNNS